MTCAIISKVRVMSAAALQRLVFDLRMPLSSIEGFWRTGSRIDLCFLTSRLVQPLFMMFPNSAADRERQFILDSIKAPDKLWQCLGLCVRKFVPPRGSGWVLDSVLGTTKLKCDALKRRAEPHSLPRGGTDLMSMRLLKLH